MKEDIIVKGIVLSLAPQAEYSKRVLILSDRLGKITAFAQGAAKQSSHLIGKLRPMTAAEFSLGKGRSAYNIHGVSLMDPFAELSQDLDCSLYGMYFLEMASYFAQEGMVEEEAKSMLNLLYVTLDALRKGSLEKQLIRAVYELRLLKIEGEYVASPKGGEAFEELWREVLMSPLSRLYDDKRFEDEEACGELIREALLMSRRLCDHEFNAGKLLPG